jgi:hypothetical protein
VIYDMGTGGEALRSFRPAPQPAPSMANNQVVELIAQFTAEAESVASELRHLLPHSDPGRYLDLSRRYSELKGWITTCQAHA